MQCNCNNNCYDNTSNLNALVHSNAHPTSLQLPDVDIVCLKLVTWELPFTGKSQLSNHMTHSTNLAWHLLPSNAVSFPNGGKLDAALVKGSFEITFRAEANYSHCSSFYSALTALSPLFHTLSSGVTRYYEVAFPSDGVTVTLDVTQGSVTVYASDNIWNANAQDYDWRVTANTTSGFTEAFFNSSTLNRQVRSILFLAIVGGQSTSTFIMNNAVGDIRTKGTLSKSPIIFQKYACGQ